MSRWLISVVVAALWGVPGAALAQQSVVLLSLVSEDGDDGLAAELSDAVYSEASQVSEWSVSSNRPSLMQMTMANDCEIANPSCRAEIGRTLGADQVIYGTLRRSGGDAVAVELLLFDSTNGDVVASAHAQMSATQRGALPTIAVGLLRELRGLASGYAAAPVVPSAAPDDGAVRPDVAPLDGEPLADEPIYDEGESTGGSNDWLGYTLLGVSGVSLGGVVFSWIQIEAASSDANFTYYREAVGSSQPAISDVCKEAQRGQTHGTSQAILAEVRDQCDRGATFETLQYVFLGAFAVSGGLGLYFLLDGDGDEDAQGRSDAPRLAVEPRVGPQLTGLSARLSF